MAVIQTKKRWSNKNFLKSILCIEGLEREKDKKGVEGSD